MTLQKVCVADGINLSCITTDKFKTGVLTLSLTIPLTRQNSAFNIVLPGVLRRGTQKYPSMASLNMRLDELYAACVEIRSSRTGKNISLVFTAEMLDESYSTDGTAITDGVIDVIAQMLLHPSLGEGGFESAKVEQEIRFCTDAIRAEINNTRAYAAVRCAELMHRDDPNYPTLKNLENDISLINGASLADYYRRLLSEASIEAFYVGSLSVDSIAEKLRCALISWQAKDHSHITLPSAESATPYISVTEEMPVSQGKLSMGFRTGVCNDGCGDGFYAAILLNEIFGGSPASKLFMNVREKMSLCYYCSSAYSQYTGNITVSAGVNTANRDIARGAILSQLDDIRAGKISDAELHAAKTSLENAYRQIYDNPFELQAFLGARAMFGIEDGIEESREKLSRVTLGQVIDIAKQTVLDTEFFIEGTLSDGDEEDEE